MDNYCCNKFGKLFVIKKVDNKNIKDRHKMYLCKCDCGKEIVVRGTCLRKGQASCGCERNKRLSIRNTKHGMSSTRIHNIWGGMLNRTKYKVLSEEKRYWGRGIYVCKQWETFDNFYNWAIKNGYKDNLTIDRIDNDKGYCPENCRWATVQEQANNRSTNVFIEYHGEKYTLTQWANKLNITSNALRKRIKNMELKNLCRELKNRFL